MATDQVHNVDDVEETLRAEVKHTIIQKSGNLCPLAVRLAWHATGTYDKNDDSGGSDGATMRFAPEINSPQNKGLKHMHDILKHVKQKFPHLSHADIWTFAGAQAVELTGGPQVPFFFGRTDDQDSARCPKNDRLPDASQGAEHLRDVFYRMGFNDRDIVALSGAHTLGSCHRLRSGFEGRWTSNPFQFDNEYYINLLEHVWKPRQWDGPLQYQDRSGELMMLPTDIALIKDEKFLSYVKSYAANEKLFFNDFADAFGRLLSLGYRGNKVVDSKEVQNHEVVSPMKLLIKEHPQPNLPLQRDHTNNDNNKEVDPNQENGTMTAEDKVKQQILQLRRCREIARRLIDSDKRRSRNSLIMFMDLGAIRTQPDAVQNSDPKTVEDQNNASVQNQTNEPTTISRAGQNLVPALVEYTTSQDKPAINDHDLRDADTAIPGQGLLRQHQHDAVRDVPEVVVHQDLQPAEEEHDQVEPTDAPIELPHACKLCRVPETAPRTTSNDLHPDRQRMLLVLDSKWVNGTTLNYYLFTKGEFRGSSRQYDLVRQAFQEWKNVGIGLDFKEVTDISQAQVRIGFKDGDGSWSFIGRQILDKTLAGPNDRTMNIGWDNDQTLDTCIHEIGHTLGFPHEHQNPLAGIEWNEPEVYKELGGPPNNWPKDQTYYNVIRKLDPNEIQGSNWDPNSIMHYPFRAGLILKPEKYQTEPLIPAGGLSDSDRSRVSSFYPPLEAAKPNALLANSPQTLQIRDGEHAQFAITPTETGEYTLSTTGHADTVMVLFETTQDGTLKQVAADDDSGEERNALITCTLHEGVEYVLQIRLYWMNRTEQPTSEADAPAVQLKKADFSLTETLAQSLAEAINSLYSLTGPKSGGDAFFCGSLSDSLDSPFTFCMLLNTHNLPNE